MRKLSLKNESTLWKLSLKNDTSFRELFSIFLTAKKALGVQEKTLETYRAHLNAVAHHIDIDRSISDFRKSDFDSMIVSMRNSNLAPKSIKSYLITVRAFLNWGRAEGYCNITIGQFKCPETMKDPYTDEELKVLLQKPNMKRCTFAEYRNWVMVNFLLDSGCRAATLRSIQIRDLDLEHGVCNYRHTKNKKIQAIPLSSTLVCILKEYIVIRKGAPMDVLFCTIYGDPLNESSLRKAIYSYNKSRGINKTSTHLFRHTFAKKYLLDCKGNALVLQQLLGHSSLDMTRHYCNLYSTDILNAYDMISPLSQIQKKQEKIRMKKN